jgi:tetratricopeptide (TPR) repeat protein
MHRCDGVCICVPRCGSKEKRVQRYLRALLLAVVVASSVFIPACVRGPGVGAGGSATGVEPRLEMTHPAEKERPQAPDVDAADGNAPDRTSNADVVASPKDATTHTSDVMREREPISTPPDKLIERPAVDADSTSPASAGTSALPAMPSMTSSATAPSAEETDVIQSDARPFAALMPYLFERSSWMSLLVAFLIGLTLGILIAVPLLLRHRHRISDRSSSAAASRAAKTARPNPPSASTFSDAAELHTEAAGSVLPRADHVTQPEAISEKLSSDAAPAPLWSVTTQQALSREPIVEISIERFHSTTMLPMQDRHRATALLQEGEYEQALAVIEPYLSDLPRIAPAAPRASGDVEKNHPALLALAQLHADIRWAIATRSQSAGSYAEASRALEILLVVQPDHATTMFRLACSLLRQVDGQSDEMAKIALLQHCIDTLTAIGMTNAERDPLHLDVLGEALSRRALLDVVVDEARFAEAESTLRQALAIGASDDSDAAWWLQKLLVLAAPAMAPHVVAARLQESMALSRLGLKSSGNAIAQGRWQAALLRAELAHVRMDSLNKASNRLRLRTLYARYAPSMKNEQSPEVLAAWVDVLCVLAASMVGHAAMERYREIDDVLGRLSYIDPLGDVHMAAWARMARSRLLIENESGKRDLLARTWLILDPQLDRAGASLRLQASLLALEQAALATDREAERAWYARALELARPLTSVPSLAVSALGCALRALLATGDDKERRVYAKCLDVIAPEDRESLCLLAKSNYRDGKFADACGYLEAAWLKRDKVWPEECADLWRDALQRWKDLDSGSEAFQRNQRQWRHADHRRYR